jgi:hypothetical protein
MTPLDLQQFQQQAMSHELKMTTQSALQPQQLYSSPHRSTTPETVSTQHTRSQHSYSQKAGEGDKDMPEITARQQGVKGGFKGGWKSVDWMSFTPNNFPAEMTDAGGGGGGDGGGEGDGGEGRRAVRGKPARAPNAVAYAYSEKSPSPSQLEEFVLNLDSFREAGDDLQLHQVYIIQGLKRHKKNLQVVQCGCEALLELTPSLEGDQLEHALTCRSDCQALLLEMQATYLRLGNLGAVEAVIDVMVHHHHQKHASCPHLVCICIRILLLLARNDENRPRIVEHDGIHVITKAMEQHGGEASIQEYSCGALRNLAINSREHCCAIADAAGIECIVAALQRHASHSRIVQVRRL